MKFIRFSVAALLLCLVFACNNSSSENEVALSKTMEDVDAATDTVTYRPQTPPGSDQKPQQPGATSPTYADWEKKIIKNANLNIETEDYNAYNQQVHASIKQWGGYIA